MKTDSIPNLLKKMLNTIGAVVCPRREKALKKDIKPAKFSFGTE